MASLTIKTGERVIYDLGANNGSDLPYYLKKATKVIAVEANPALTDLMRKTFPEEIRTGHLIVENIAVTEFSLDKSIDFFIHRQFDWISTAIEPNADELEDYKVENVASVSIADLIAKHGTPYFIKIDLEGYDIAILRGLFKAGIVPEFISAEGHHPAVFGLLSGLGTYEQFNIVRGREVGKYFYDFKFGALDGSPSVYSFPKDAAGPFGDDLPGAWLDSQEFFKLLRVEGPGWYDIHARLGKPAHPSKFKVRLSVAMRAALRLSKPELVASFWWAGLAFSKIRKAVSWRGQNK
jgi:FkbM family methyltransferase